MKSCTMFEYFSFWDFIELFFWEVWLFDKSCFDQVVYLQITTEEKKKTKLNIAKRYSQARTQQTVERNGVSVLHVRNFYRWYTFTIIIYLNCQMTIVIWWMLRGWKGNECDKYNFDLIISTRNEKKYQE